MEKQQLIPNIEIGDIQNDMNDPIIKECLELEKYGEDDTYRQNRINNIIENRDERDKLHEMKAKPKKLSRFKNDIFMMTSRKISEEGDTLPKPIAESEHDQLLDGLLAEKVLETQYTWADFPSTYEKIIDYLKTDGTCYLHLGYRNDEMLYSVREFANIVHDPDCTNFNADPNSDDAPGWACIRFEYDYDTAIKLASDIAGEDMTGKIMPGLPKIREYDEIIDKIRKDDKHKDWKIGIHYFYHQRKNKLIIYAGGAATKLYDGENKFKVRNSRGDMVSRIPLIAFYFSMERQKAWAMGLYDITKDIATEWKDALDRAFTHLKIQLNPQIFLFTDQGSSILGQMESALDMQELGVPPLILAGTDEKVKMETLKTDPGVINAIKEWRDLAFDSLGYRLGINPRQMDQVRQTFSEYERKNQFENMAIAQVNEINKNSLALVARWTIDLMAHSYTRKRKYKLPVSIKLEDGKEDYVRMDLSKVLNILKDWQGTFQIDTNIKIPINTSEKMATMNEVIGRLEGMIGNQMIMDMDMIEPVIEGLYQKLRIRDLEDTITREKIRKAAQSIIKRNTGQMQQQAQAQQGAGQDGQAMSPESAIQQEAGVGNPTGIVG